MKTAPAILLALLLAGCASSRTDPDHPPTFNASVDQVYDAALRACNDYFRRVDIDDRLHHRIEVDNYTTWAGHSYVVIDVEANAEGQAVVSIESNGRGPHLQNQGRTERDVKEISRRITNEMDRAPAPEPTAEARLNQLEALRAKGLVTDSEYTAKRAAIIEGL